MTDRHQEKLMKQKSFEERLANLEQICDLLRSPDTKLDDAKMHFEEGIKLFKSLEKELASIESKVEFLLKQSTEEESPARDILSEYSGLLFQEANMKQDE